MNILLLVLTLFGAYTVYMALFKNWGDKAFEKGKRMPLLNIVALRGEKTFVLFYKIINIIILIAFIFLDIRLISGF